ncbi:MAG: hypothetical protein HYV09_38280 [Deltaproteobacteria bacterium]|nr:hypothetical protein [Deltaproteobacteria bacterium]
MALADARASTRGGSVPVVRTRTSTSPPVPSPIAPTSARNEAPAGTNPTQRTIAGAISVYARRGAPPIATWVIASRRVGAA